MLNILDDNNDGNGKILVEMNENDQPIGDSGS